MSQRKDPEDGQDEPTALLGQGGQVEQNKKAEVVTELYGQHHPHLVSYVHNGILRTGDRQDAQDLVHEIWRKILEPAFDLARIGRPLGYLVRSATYAIYAFNKRSKRDRGREVRIDRPDDEEPGKGELQLAAEDRRGGLLDELIDAGEVERVLPRLSPRHRPYIEMQLEGMSSRQIAAAIGVTPDQAERTLTEARQRLKSLLSDVMHGWVRK